MTASIRHQPTGKAVIFDLDGTLLESLTDLGEAMNKVLLASNFPSHPIDAYRYFVGDGMLKLVLRALPSSAAGNPAIVEECLVRMKTEYGRSWSTHSKLYPGIPALLDQLKLRDMPMCILTNKPADLTAAIVERFLATWKFTVARGATAQFPLKPDPSGALAIAAELNMAPEAFLYMGDTAVDMMTANRAGMFAIGCLWGFRNAAELRESGARILLSHPMELLDFIG